MSARCSAERHRELIQRLRNQIILARWIGERAVTIARRELQQAWDAGRTGGGGPVVSVAVEPAAAPAPPSVDGDVAVDEAPTVAAAEAVVVDTLDPSVPFDGYDTSPASHIVQRLRRMNVDELRNAGAYEAQHRNRRTVLGMVDQLLAG